MTKLNKVETDAVKILKTKTTALVAESLKISEATLKALVLKKVVKEMKGKNRSSRYQLTKTGQAVLTGPVTIKEKETLAKPKAKGGKIKLKKVKVNKLPAKKKVAAKTAKSKK